MSLQDTFAERSPPSAGKPALSPERSRVVTVLHPRSGLRDDRDSFRKAFLDTLRGKAEGVLTAHLFCDLPSRKGELNFWGTTEDIPFGAKAWDAHIESSVHQNDSKNHYGFASGDMAIIHSALEQGLLTTLPANIEFYSYGPGDLIAVQGKDCQILEAIFKSNDHKLSSYAAVDINPRYAEDAAYEVRERFNVPATAYEGDFMEGYIDIPPCLASPVIAIFGGPFANAPIIGKGTSKQKATEYFSKLAKTHGVGSKLIMTVDARSDEDVLLKDYGHTDPFEAFVLSAFPRAVYEGIILNEDYDVFKHWKMKATYDHNTSCVKLVAICKKTHTLKTDDGDIFCREGIVRSIILSNKWDKPDYNEILTPAGINNLKMYEIPNDRRKLLTADVSFIPK